MTFNNISEVVSFVSKRKQLPEWQRELFSQYSDEVQVHSKGQLFYKIDRLFPNEHPLSKEHRVLSFESITKGSFWKGVNNVTRIFHNSSYSFEASEATIDYVTANNFEKKNLFAYFLEKWCENALANDPNSRIVVYPVEFMQGRNIPQVLFVPSKDIQYMDDDTIVFISEAESVKDYNLSSGRVTATVYDNNIDSLNIVERAGKNTFVKKVETVYKRKVFHVFDSVGFYRLEETEQDNMTFDYEYWKHNKNYFPVYPAGGMDAGKGVYQSFFSVFCPFGNLALLQHSQHTAVNFMFSFPRMSEVETPCDAHGCNDGMVLTDDTEHYPDGKKKCGQCLGVGYTTNQTPYKVYRKRLEPNTMQEDMAKAVLNTDDVKFYTPDTSILEYSKKEWKEYLDFAEQSVYVSQKIMTGNIESAKSKEFDRDDRYSFISNIAKVFYERLRQVAQAFEMYLNNSPVDVTVNIPHSFAVETEMDTFEALTTILNSNAPVLIKANKIETFINKFVSASSPVRRFFTVLRKVDLLMYYSDAQISTQKAGGVVTAKQWATHIYAFPVLSRMFYADRALFELDDDAVIVKLNKELEEYMPDERELKQKLMDEFNKA